MILEDDAACAPEFPLAFAARDGHGSGGCDGAPFGSRALPTPVRDVAVRSRVPAGLQKAAVAEAPVELKVLAASIPMHHACMGASAIASVDARATGRYHFVCWIRWTSNQHGDTARPSTADPKGAAADMSFMGCTRLSLSTCARRCDSLIAGRSRACRARSPGLCRGAHPLRGPAAPACTSRRGGHRGAGKSWEGLPVCLDATSPFSRSRPCARGACSARTARLRRP